MKWWKERIYMDYASATPLLSESLRAMNAAEEHFANPGAIHEDGVRAKRTLEDAREAIARELGAKPRQIVFTSGLTESNNLAILGLVRKLQLSGKSIGGTHWIVSAIEHDSVLECFSEVERLGGIVTFIDPSQEGLISPEAITRTLRPETVFVSIGWANNEIGVVQPLAHIARSIEKHTATSHSIIFHADAGQAPLYISPQVHTLGVDMLSLGAGKLYGPRTIGALYVKEPDTLAPMHLGGGQERGLRAGTEDVVPAVGLAKALKVISEERKDEYVRVQKLRDALLKGLSQKIPGLVVNGAIKHMLPHMLNISIPDISSEYVVLSLDREGIAISTKSACRSGERSSHVVQALGGPSWRSENTLRFSLGRSTTDKDIWRASETLERSLKAYLKPET